MRTRLAPSPTGALHVGNARTFLVTWLHARSHGGEVLLREDDLDGPRVKPGRMREAVAEIRWLGLDWDAHLPTLVQSRRTAVYDRVADELVASGAAYPCVCTRSEVAEASSAPHGSEGPAYPGTCRGRFRTLEEASQATGRPAALRFVVEPGSVAFDDLLQGPQAFDPAVEIGDFVIRKNDGVAAYQLATVVDDAESGVDMVIRGDDLLPSTARQILLQRALGLPAVRYLHLPLVVGPDGRRLAKRHGDTTLRNLRELGWDAARIVGWIGATMGLAEPGERVEARYLLDRYSVEALEPARVVLDVGAFLSGEGP